MPALRQAIEPHLVGDRRGFLFPRTSQPVPAPPRHGSPGRGEQGSQRDASPRKPAADPHRKPPQHRARIAARVREPATRPGMAHCPVHSLADPTGFTESSASLVPFSHTARQSRPGLSRRNPGAPGNALSRPAHGHAADHGWHGGPSGAGARVATVAYRGERSVHASGIAFGMARRVAADRDCDAEARRPTSYRRAGERSTRAACRDCL